MHINDEASTYGHVSLAYMLNYFHFEYFENIFHKKQQSGVKVVNLLNAALASFFEWKQKIHIVPLQMHTVLYKQDFTISSTQNI